MTGIIRIGSAAIIEKSTEAGPMILLGKRAKEPYKGYWVPPGGGIKWGEYANDAAKRELEEETGLKIETYSIAHVAESITEDEHRIIIYWNAVVLEGELKPQDDLSDAKWFYMDELVTLPIPPTSEEALQVTEWI
jgi:ADP-ribose pyrophosphatase YjhB (NUDIX family)